ncbi:MAG: type II secretion system protein, partial [Planctomycetota bacterium]
MSTKTRRGFSLIELLVTIGLIALLIGILLPALAGSRQSAQRLVALSNARSTSQAFELYLGQNNGSYPYATPVESESPLGGLSNFVVFRWYPEGTIIANSDLFSVEWGWPSLLASVTPWNEAYQTWTSPGLGLELPSEGRDWQDQLQSLGLNEGQPFSQFSETISWRLSNNFTADPAVWNPSANTPADESLVRGVTRSEVAYPASKVLFWDTHLAWMRNRPELVDGHWAAP